MVAINYSNCENQTKALGPICRQDGPGETTKNMPGQQNIHHETARKTTQTMDRMLANNLQQKSNKGKQTEDILENGEKRRGRS